MKKGINKFLYFVLASVLLLSVFFAGCEPNTDPATNTPGNAVSGSGTSGGSNDAQPRETRVVSLLGRDMNNPGRPWWTVENYHDWEAGKVFDAKMEEIGIVLDVETVANDQYGTAVKTRQDAWLDMPDVILASGSHSDWVGYGKTGRIWNIRELLEQYDEDGSIWAYMEQHGGSALSTILDENGALWWFPYVLDQGINGRANSFFTISIRADWLEAIGEEYAHFYTPDELLEILVRFREEDANGNGVADEVINFNPASEWEPISSAFGIGMRYIYALSDGSGVYSKLDHENFPAFIEYCQQLYKSGVFSTEILNEGNNIKESNRASAIFDYAAATYHEKTVVGFEEIARYAPAVLDDDAGTNGYILPAADNPFMVTSGWFVNKDCKDPQAVVDLMDFIYSDECSDLFYWGVEGVSYEYDEELGKKVFIDGATLYAEDDTSRSPLNNVVGANILPSALNIPTTIEEMLAYETGYPEKDAFTHTAIDAIEKSIPYQSQTQPYAMMTDAEAKEYNAVSETVGTYINELIIDLITEKKSLDDLSTYREEVGKLGLDSMLEIRKAQHARFMKP